MGEGITDECHFAVDNIDAAQPTENPDEDHGIDRTAHELEVERNPYEEESEGGVGAQFSFPCWRRMVLS